MLKEKPINVDTAEDQPFWKDEPDNQVSRVKNPKWINVYSIFIIVLINLFSYFLLFFLFYKISSVLALFLFIFYIILFGMGIVLGINRRKQTKLVQKNILQIQEQAREKTKALLIGSAVHVAGNPNLLREQNIVLALTSSELLIFSYDHDVPIETINLNQITAIHTVVYDDDRIPHMETVDSTAQALQITNKYRNSCYDCLFRNMKKIRPIDWYHGIQKARLQNSVQTN